MGNVLPMWCRYRVNAPDRLTEERLASLYDAEGFGGEKTMRARAPRVHRRGPSPALRAPPSRETAADGRTSRWQRRWRDAPPPDGT